MKNSKFSERTSSAPRPKSMNKKSKPIVKSAKDSETSLKSSWSKEPRTQSTSKTLICNSSKCSPNFNTKTWWFSNCQNLFKATFNLRKTTTNPFPSWKWRTVSTSTPLPPTSPPTWAVRNLWRKNRAARMPPRNLQEPRRHSETRRRNCWSSRLSMARLREKIKKNRKMTANRIKMLSKVSRPWKTRWRSRSMS